FEPVNLAVLLGCFNVVIYLNSNKNRTIARDSEKGLQFMLPAGSPILGCAQLGGLNESTEKPSKLVNVGVSVRSPSERSAPGCRRRADNPRPSADACR